MSLLLIKKDDAIVDALTFSQSCFAFSSRYPSDKTLHLPLVDARVFA